MSVSARVRKRVAKVPEPESSAPDNIPELKAREKEEPVAAFLKMNLLELKPGYARVGMKLKPEHLNFNGLVFGGVIMAIADQAFAYASNSLALPSYATQFNIHFIASAAVADELTAECQVLKSGKRAGISEITVTNQAGKLIARASGTTIPVS